MKARAVKVGPRAGRRAGGATLSKKLAVISGKRGGGGRRQPPTKEGWRASGESTSRRTRSDLANTLPALIFTTTHAFVSPFLAHPGTQSPH